MLLRRVKSNSIVHQELYTRVDNDANNCVFANGPYHISITEIRIFCFTGAWKTYCACSNWTSPRLGRLADSFVDVFSKVLRVVFWLFVPRCNFVAWACLKAISDQWHTVKNERYFMSALEFRHCDGLLLGGYITKSPVIRNYYQQRYTSHILHFSLLASFRFSQSIAMISTNIAKVSRRILCTNSRWKTFCSSMCVFVRRDIETKTNEK